MLRNNKLRKTSKDFVSSAEAAVIFFKFFHNIEECFCFDEAFTNLEFKAITSRAFMLRGMYGINSLQEKKSTNKIFAL